MFVAQAATEHSFAPEERNEFFERSHIPLLQSGRLVGCVSIYISSLRDEDVPGALESAQVGSVGDGLEGNDKLKFVVLVLSGVRHGKILQFQTGDADCLFFGNNVRALQLRLRRSSE